MPNSTDASCSLGWTHAGDCLPPKVIYRQGAVHVSDGSVEDALRLSVARDVLQGARGLLESNPSDREVRFAARGLTRSLAEVLDMVAPEDDASAPDEGL